MNRYFLCVFLTLLLLGCGANEEVAEIRLAQQQAAVAQTKQKAAEEKEAAVRSKAEEDRSAAHLLTGGLSIGVLLALLVGVGIGSASKKDAAKPRLSSPRHGTDG